MKKIIILLISAITIFAITPAELDDFISTPKTFSAALIHVSVTPMGINKDIGKIHVNRPMVSMVLADQNFVVNDNTLYSWYCGETDGFMFESSEMSLFSSKPFQKLSESYDITISDTLKNKKECYKVVGKSKEDAQILTFEVVIDKKERTPLLVEWKDISGTENTVQVENLTKEPSPNIVFTVPNDINFEGVSNEGR